MNINKDTFLVQLTVEDLIRILEKRFPALSERITESKQTEANNIPADGPTFSGHLLYGLWGIESFFSVSHKTAQLWKDTWLAPAVRQHGRKIITDADYAMTLFNNRKLQSK